MSRATGPAPNMPALLLRPMSVGYGLAVAARNWTFDAGLRRIARLDLRVVSVGNVVVGGSGKTPVTAWLARRLLDAGRHPLIALRGYGAADPSRSDEAMEYRRLLPAVPVAVGADRAAAIARLRSAPGGAAADIVLLDDGFQHRRIRRDLDIVLVDAGRSCLEGPGAALLPAGWLREPARALARADAVVLTHADVADARLIEQIVRLHGRPPLARFTHVWRGVDRFEAGASSAPSREPVEVLRGLRLATVLGVAQPQRVRAMLERAGATVVEDVPVRDHQAYDSALVQRIRALAASCDGLLTTAKDWTKLVDHARELAVPVFVPALEVEAVEGGDALLGRVLPT